MIRRAALVLVAVVGCRSFGASGGEQHRGEVKNKLELGFGWCDGILDGSETRVEYGLKMLDDSLAEAQQLDPDVRSKPWPMTGAATTTVGAKATQCDAALNERIAKVHACPKARASNPELEKILTEKSSDGPMSPYKRTSLRLWTPLSQGRVGPGGKTLREEVSAISCVERAQENKCYRVYLLFFREKPDGADWSAWAWNPGDTIEIACASIAP